MITNTLFNCSRLSFEEYHPFGTSSYRTGSMPLRYRYCGKERDEESGLYYYGMRYYISWLCRFVSVDSLKDKYPFYCSYQYAGNKPISFIDLDGLEPAEPKEEKKETEESKVQKKLAENSEKEIADGNADVHTETACYPSVWKRLLRAFEDIFGKDKAPSVFYVKDHIQTDKAGERWYPGGNTKFKILASSEYENPKWKNLPKEFRGKGLPGALEFAGLGILVDDIWSGELKPGAVLQMWTSQKDFEGIRDGKGFDKESNSFLSELLNLEDFGHSVIFLGYEKNVFGNISEIRYLDQYGENTVSKNSWKYPVIFGANLNQIEK